MFNLFVLICVGLLVTVSSDCSEEWSAASPNDFICPSQCSTDPCTLDETSCCKSGTYHSEPGCDQCQSGYFQKDYNYPCVHCQATFGNECLHCQDFNGCGQCIDSCTRTYDELCGLWYCDCGNEPSDMITYEIAQISTFGGVWPYGDTGDMPYYNDEGEYDDTDGDETVENVYDRIQLRAVEASGRQTITVFSMSLISTWLAEEININEIDGSIDLPNDDGQSDDPADDPDDGPTPCEIEIYDQDSPNPNDNNDGDGEARRLRSRLLNVIFDPDTRTEITSTPTKSVSKHVGYLYFEDKDGGGHRCTAFAIYDRYLLTAGHCVFSRDSKDWYVYSTYKFYPKRTSSNVPTPITDITRIAAMRGWTKDSNRNYDVGIITLGSSHGLGWPCFGYTSKRLKKGDYEHYRGYPSKDKENLDTRGLFTGSGTIWKRKTHQYWSRTIDWTGGASGSPLFTYNDDLNERCVYGVVTHHGDTVSWFTRKEYNGACRFTSSKFHSICAYTGRC